MNQKVFKYRNLEYVDVKNILLIYSALIINVKSLNRVYGSLKEFTLYYNLPGLTNGKILVLYELSDPPRNLIEFAQDELEHYGLKDREDYIIASKCNPSERSIEIRGCKTERHPAFKDLGWADCLIINDENYVYHVDGE